MNVTNPPSEAPDPRGVRRLTLPPPPRDPGFWAITDRSPPRLQRLRALWIRTLQFRESLVGHYDEPPATLRDAFAEILRDTRANLEDLAAIRATLPRSERRLADAVLDGLRQIRRLAVEVLTRELRP